MKSERVILHCDANSFFASVEVASLPDLKNKPVAVAGNPKKRTGIILAKNEIAKKFGIQTGEVIWQAKQKCPELICLPPHYELYEEYSKKLRKIYEFYTDKVESFGIDECWLDVTNSLRLFGSGEKIAEEIREKVKKELKITVSIGVSFCKLFAKLGSDLKKPDAITIISKKDFKKIVYPMPIEVLLGIGRQLKKSLNRLNIFVLGDYVEVENDVLLKKYGKVGLELKEKLLGNDNDEVLSYVPPPKSIGNGTTTIVDIISRDEVSATVAYLSEKIASRLRKHAFLTTNVHVTLKTINFIHEGHSKKIDFPTSSANIIAEEVMNLIDSFWQYKEKVRSIRISCSGLISESSSSQTSLFENKKKQNLGYGLDAVRDKYGSKAISIASNLNSDFLST